MSHLYLLLLLAVLPSYDARESPDVRTDRLVRLDSSAAARHAQFRAWAAKHEKQYLVSIGPEYTDRLHVFAENYAKVQQMIGTGANRSWTLSSDGPFMDLREEEFRSLHGGFRAPGSSTVAGSLSAPPPQQVPAGALPRSVDWRAKGAVTPVKKQGDCGSCWAFSATGAVEAAHFLASGALVSVSEQQLVSCDALDAGCSGGQMDNAFQYIIANGGIDSEADYSYANSSLHGGDAPACNRTKEGRRAVGIDRYVDVIETEGALLRALAGRPVSVAINMSAWQFYGGGIFEADCGTNSEPNPDHSVLVVGYHLPPTNAEQGDAHGDSWTEHGVNTRGGDLPGAAEALTDDGYYIVKNCWGPTWGEGGYIRLPINRGKYGMCGIARYASFPVAFPVV